MHQPVEADEGAVFRFSNVPSMFEAREMRLQQAIGAGAPAGMGSMPITVGPRCCDGTFVLGMKTHTAACINNGSKQTPVRIPAFAKKPGEADAAWARRLAAPTGLDGYGDYWSAGHDAYLSRDLIKLTEDVITNLDVFDLDWQQVAIFINPDTAENLLLTTDPEDGTPPARWLYGMALETSEHVPLGLSWLYDGAIYYGDRRQPSPEEISYADTGDDEWAAYRAHYHGCAE